MAKLDEQLAALATMSPAQLRTEWARVRREPIPTLSPDLLMRGIAYRLQERHYGGLPTAARKELAGFVRKLERGDDIATDRTSVPKPGTRLVRDWQGRSYHVLVLDDGFLFEDRRYGSLSQIARTITGAAWSGPRFFGLKIRSDAKTVRVHG